MFEPEVIAKIDQEFEERKAEELVLNEIAVKGDNCGIEVNGDGDTYRGFDKDPYMKLFIGKAVRATDKYIRISVKEPRIIVHSGGRWGTFSKKDRELLIKLLNSPSKKIIPGENRTCKNGWEAVIVEIINIINNERSASNKLPYDFSMWPMPDYNLIPVANYDNK